MPRDHIERSVILFGRKKVTGKFGNKRPFCFCIFVEMSDWGLEVPSIGQTVGTNRAQFWELKMSLIQFKYVTSDWTIQEVDSVSDTARNDADLVGSN